MDTPTHPADHAPATFLDWLRDQRNGTAAGEWGDALTELIEAVTEHGKPGTLTITIKVKPIGNGRTLEVVDDLVVKKPTAPRGSSIFFATEAGGLSRNDPAQTVLPLREVPAPTVRTPEEAAR